MLPIRFNPYIGKEYQTQEFKILILGESHYLGEKDFEDYLKTHKRIELITSNVINDYLNYKKSGKNFVRWMNTFTKFSNALNAKKSTSNDVLVLWENLAFYNYVQVPTSGPRVSPTKEEFNLSFNAFKDVVEKIKPNLIFFWGHRLWNNFPKENYRSLTKGANKIHFLTLSSNFPFMVVPHPSSSKFNYGIKKEIKNYINAIKTVGKIV